MSHFLNISPGCAAFVTLLLPFASTSPALAGETIVYDGSEPGLLRNDPLTPGEKALFPDALSGNTVTVTGGNIDGISPTTGSVYGGQTTGAGTVDKNTVTVSGGLIGANVFGGGSYAGDATNNTVVINGGSVTGAIFGGIGFVNTTGNTVVVSGGSVGANILGGYSAFGAATGNTIIVSGGSVGGSIFSGTSFSGDATGNSVILSGNPVFDPVNSGIYGGNGGVVTITSAATA